MDKILAFLAAAIFIFFPAIIALNKQKVTGVIYAVYVGIGRFTTLVTIGNDLIGDPLSQPLIKDKILSMKFVC